MPKPQREVNIAAGHSTSASGRILDHPSSITRTSRHQRRRSGAGGAATKLEIV
jgi:hypothetical protein